MDYDTVVSNGSGKESGKLAPKHGKRSYGILLVEGEMPKDSICWLLCPSNTRLPSRKKDEGPFELFFHESLEELPTPSRTETRNGFFCHWNKDGKYTGSSVGLVVSFVE